MEFTSRGLKSMMVEIIKSLKDSGDVTEENCKAVTRAMFMVYSQLVYAPPEMIEIFNMDRGETYNMIADMLIPDVGEEFAENAYNHAVEMN